MANTLWSYFKQRGETLPSIEKRRQRYGLGGEYSGTAAQNVALLSRLGGGTPAGQPTQQPGQPTAQPAQTQQPAGQPAGAVPTDWRGQMAQMEQYRGEQTEQAGIPELRASIGGLRKEIGRTETLLESLRPDIEARTQDFLVPEAYRRRMEAVERQPLTQELSGLTRGLGVQEEALSGRMSDIDYRTQLASTLMREQVGRETKEPKAPKKASRTELRDKESSDVARFFAIQGTRAEAEEAAKAMIGQGYSPDVVYDELERQFPKSTDGEYKFGE